MVESTGKGKSQASDKLDLLKSVAILIWNVWQRNIQALHSPGPKAAAFRMVYESFF